MCNDSYRLEKQVSIARPLASMTLEPPPRCSNTFCEATQYPSQNKEPTFLKRSVANFKWSLIA